MAQNIQLCFGKFELAVKISFCFPRCSTRYCQQNLAPGISALTCQIRLHPPLYSRSSWTAHIKVKNWLFYPSGSLGEAFYSGCFHPTRQIWKKNSLTLVFGWHLCIIWAAADWAKSRVQLFPQFASQINVLLNELLPKSRCLKIWLVSLLANGELLNVSFFFPDTRFFKPHPLAIKEHSSKDFLALHSLQTWDDY